MTSILTVQTQDGVQELIAPGIDPLYGLVSRLLVGWHMNILIEETVMHNKRLNFVDVGACVGSWSIVMARRYPDSFIKSIEPHPDNYECLCRNAQGLKNIETINCAADEKEGRIRLSMPDVKSQIGKYRTIDCLNNYGWTSAYGIEENGFVEVEARPLDEMVKHVDILKIDVEGMETRVLSGSKRILKEERPIIQIEMRERNRDRLGETIADLEATVEAYGYKKMIKDMADIIYFPVEGKEYDP